MLFRLLVLFFISIYSVSITTETVFARNNRKRKSSKKTASKRNKRKNRSQSSARSVEKVEVTNNETQENKPVNTATTVTNNNTQTNQTTQNSTKNNEPTKPETTSEKEQDEIKSNPNDKPTTDISKDKKWEEFRLCMQQGCSGGDDQPTNVECYKSITFDTQFNNCKPLIEESKRSDFKKYFLNTFIPNEKKEFCENKEGPLQGKYENDTCIITIKFKRNAHKNECLSSCDKVERTKTIPINKPFTCSPEWFKVDPCYKDTNDCSTAKVKKITGGIAIAGGVVTGLVAGLTAVPNKKETTIEVDGEDGKKKQVTVSDQEELKKYEKKMDGKAYETATSNIKKNASKDRLTGAMTGISAGLEGVKQGTADLITASLIEKEKGEALKGNCILPNGSAISEGMSKKITW